jgi:thiamine-phosphate pyrophosphorylase
MSARPRFDPTLYLVTDPDLLEDRELEEVVVAAVRGGVTLVQLRDKHAGAESLLSQARALKTVLEPLGVPLIVNDRVEVARAAGCGCHVGQTDLAPSAARAILGPDAILGVTIDAVEQADLVDPTEVDYVAYGPFASTPTKPDAGAEIGPEGITAVRGLTELPLVAIGGLDVDNLPAAIAAGADGIAVVRAIMADDDPEAASEELRGTITAARRRRSKRR